jgi:hypothetical protein
MKDTAAENVVPHVSYLTYEHDEWFVGRSPEEKYARWTQFWGPLFNIYSFEVIGGERRVVLWMRKEFFTIGRSHVLGRCDGNGGRVRFEEGLVNYFLNRVHRSRSSETITSKFNIYMDGVRAATADEVIGPSASVSFKAVGSEQEIARSVLSQRGVQWKTTASESSNLPYWVTEAATVLFGFYAVHNLELGMGADHSA